MVAARRLRKSMLRENSGLENIGNIDFSGYEHKKNKVRKHEDDIYIKDNLGTFDDENTYKFNLKTKYIIKIFLSIAIVFSCLCAKLLFKEQAKSNKYIGYIINEYKKDYTKEGVIEKFEDIVNSGYEKAKYIIPEALANKVKEKYLVSIKPKIADFEVQEVFNNIFTVTNTENNIIGEMQESETITVDNVNNIDTENTGVGGGEPIEVALNEASDETEFTMQDSVKEILNKNIEIRKPVEGVLTSAYGDREEIFKGVNPYHTGLDIANKLDTPIKSATCGKVTKTEKDNKYYGNNIEIETSGVTFKYAHLNKIAVAVGDEVNFDTIIGYMGSTGMSTGSHLHFEIKLNGKTVDPRQIISFY